MAQPGDRSNKPGLLSLLAGIATDAANLLSQQLSAAVLEIKEDLAAAKTAAVAVGAGLALAFVGILMVALMLAHAIRALVGIDLWICYGITGFALLIFGGLCLSIARKRASTVNFVPSESLARAREDWVWLTIGRKSDARSK